MLFYELKKLFSRTGSKLLLLLLGSILIFTAIYNIQSTYYVQPDGTSLSGISAIRELKKAKSQWNGILTEEQIKNVLQTNQDILASNPEYYPGTTDNNLANKVYSQEQGYDDIRDMINQSYRLFGQFDYYLIDRLSPNQSSSFYKNRIEGLENFLGSNKELTDNQKEYYRKQYQENQTPWQYTYQEGWEILTNSLPILQVLSVIIISLLLASLFSYEDKTRVKTILLSTCQGRSKGTLSKISAGLLLTVGIYTIVMSTYILIILGGFGFDGAFNPAQTNFFIGWESPWNISNIQAIGIMLISGLIGALIFSSITMFISYKSKSTVIASTVAFLLILIPDWLTNYISSSNLITVVKLLPDQLLNSRTQLSGFTFLDLQGIVISPLVIMTISYFVLSILVLILLYYFARREYLK
ncbi:hypothetical protein PND93_10025 [Faecalicoccus pleomorphus]|uniref:hypothetical protein n=1 Tax=Faecalicoccus pleomorphus TaxID=1323 RepID=UPI00232CD303|nr:hypothetical protein [Faecalicoccus pleomorphus]MDB7985644.1 hypothetical protein [Faecalicoccus pleomorphus]MDB7991930.1 hypothetical protein [Faecalicoccus pleomorphus]